MSSRRLVITRPARLDIRDILRYSRATWGEEQRESYAGRFQLAMDQLTQFPAAGALRDDIAIGLRSRSVGRHVLFYRFNDENITIVRVLHQRMDNLDRVDVDS